MLYAFRLSLAAQHCADIGVEQNGLFFKSSHGDGLAQIDAGVDGFGILHCHTQERHFDDAGSIAADAQFQEQDAAGSNPVTRTNFLRKTAFSGGFSALKVRFSNCH